ncbi:hypothetical protein K458DRAFT_442634 [Lentithecium fluviatile CBS 122367]|uniref:PLC-like phosphodiesterase n=1 Tax=Lentithecium fluviatile CBS 122367 TaxID=1168545 RepID=A0A6G1J2X0_9PLEO|nr:hypothetical protein K458DRAFT_442634 [Lentithecium fluviatile CBS 122367]
MKTTKLILLTAFASLALSQRNCDNAAQLCDVTGYSTFGNQYSDTTTQLDSGVRQLSTQVHIARNEHTKARELHVCHTSCALFDAGTLSDWLFEIRNWMDANAKDVVTVLLVNPDGIDARELESQYAEADIARYGYAPGDIRKPHAPSNEMHKTWPTLVQMIDKGHRLVSLIQPLKPDKEKAPYLLNEFDFFICQPDRPLKSKIPEMRNSGCLFLMNHFLYWQQAFRIQVPDNRNINNTNSWDGKGGLGTHIIDCSSQVTRQPTFVQVDFFNVVPAIAATDIMNKLRKPVGRKEMPEEAVVESSAATGPLGV